MFLILNNLHSQIPIMIVVVNDCTSIECLEVNSGMIVIEILILISTHYHSIIISYDVETFMYYVNGALFMRYNKIKAHTKQGLVLTFKKQTFQKQNVGYIRPTFVSIIHIPSTHRSRGPMDKAPDYESGDCKFESCRDHNFLKNTFYTSYYKSK